MKKGVVALLIVIAIVIFTIIFLSKIKVKPGVNYSASDYVPTGVANPTYLGPNTKPALYINPSTNQSQTQTGAVTTGGSVSVKPTTYKLTYAQALKIYRTSGYYLQIDSCRGRPGIMTIKKGSKFMIDNRDPLAVKIGLGGKNYLIPKYGFTIISADRVGINYLTCNGGGAAQINVQP